MTPESHVGRPGHQPGPRHDAAAPTTYGAAAPKTYGAAAPRTDGVPRARHSAADDTAAAPAQSPDTTILLPRMRSPKPAQPVAPDATMLMGVLIPGRTPGADDHEASGAAPEPPPRGVRVVPLRAERTAEGYRSVFSELTRLTAGEVLRTVLRTTGEVFITLGLVVLLFATYEVWGKTAIVGAHQGDLDRQLAQNWDTPAPSLSAGPTAAPVAVLPPLSGNAIARLYIPRLGKQLVVVQGVQPADIEYAPGHYPDTAMPGAIGNFSLAGHRTPAIFWDLDQIRAGDLIGVETRDTWYVYRVYGSEIVAPTAVAVVAPVPNQPGAKPTRALLTITTCNPKWDNYQRLVVHAELSRQQPRAQGKPAELGA